MEPTVKDIMSSALVYVLEGDRPELAKKHMLEFGITAVPILDADHRPIGVVSLRDLADERKIGRRVTSPARTIAGSTPLHDAARIIAESSMHHLVVVDERGQALGMLSAIDVLRAMLGMPARHPEMLEAIATTGY